MQSAASMAVKLPLNESGTIAMAKGLFSIIPNNLLDPLAPDKKNPARDRQFFGGAFAIRHL